LTVAGLQSENGRLNLRLKEIDEWRIKAGTLESTLSAKNAEFEQKVSCLKGEIDKVNIVFLFNLQIFFINKLNRNFKG
jgi:hypothetical protein